MRRSVSSISMTTLLDIGIAISPALFTFLLFCILTFHLKVIGEGTPANLSPTATTDVTIVVKIKTFFKQNNSVIEKLVLFLHLHSCYEVSYKWRKP